MNASIKNAGGTPGGTGQFFLGLVMFLGGGYLFLQNIVVRQHFNLGMSLFHWGNFGITSGMVFIPFILGIAMMFYNSRNWIGWILAGGSLVALGFGVISQLNVHLRTMSAFDLIVILVLLVGGAGLLLRSLRAQ